MNLMEQAIAQDNQSKKDFLQKHPLFGGAITPFGEYREMIKKHIPEMHDEYIEEQYKKLCSTRMQTFLDLKIGTLFHEGTVQDFHQAVQELQEHFRIKIQTDGEIG